MGRAGYIYVRDTPPNKKLQFFLLPPTFSHHLYSSWVTTHLSVENYPLVMEFELVVGNGCWQAFLVEAVPWTIGFLSEKQEY